MLLKWGHQTEAALPISPSFITLSSDCGVNISKWKCDEGKLIILDWVTLLSDVCAIWCHMYVCAGTHVRLWGHLPRHIKRQMSVCTRESGNERTHDLIHTQVCPVCNPNLLTIKIFIYFDSTQRNSLSKIYIKKRLHWTQVKLQCKLSFQGIWRWWKLMKHVKVI